MLILISRKINLACISVQASEILWLVTTPYGFCPCSETSVYVYLAICYSYAKLIAIIIMHVTCIL